MSELSSARVSRNQLLRLRERLSERDWQIIEFLTRHRFATTTQLRRAFFADHKTTPAATRACVRVLNRHLALRLLGRLERRIGGIRHGSTSFIWHLDVVGQRLSEDIKPRAARLRLSSPSPQFLDHTLAIVDTHVTLITAACNGAFVIERIEIETEAWRSYVTSSGATSILKPDLAVHLSTAEYDDHWYFEVDRGTESLPVLLAKCRAYAAYRATGRAQAQHGLFPRVLWLLPTQARADRLTAALNAEPGLDQRLFLTSTHDALLPSLTNPDGDTVLQTVDTVLQTVAGPETADPRGQHETP